MTPKAESLSKTLYDHERSLTPAIRKYVLLSSFGTVLTYRKSTFVISHHNPKLIPQDYAVVVFLEGPSDAASSLSLHPEIAQVGLPPKFHVLAEMNVALPIGTIRSERLHNARGNFTLGDGFLCAEPEGQIKTDRRQAGGWETFFSIEWEHFEALQFISDNSWHSHSKNGLIKNQDIFFKADFCFCLGDIEYPLLALIDSLKENRAIGNIIDPQGLKWQDKS